MAPILSSLSGLYKSFLTGGGITGLGVEATGGAITEYQDCLLYTSDAADE